MASEPKGSEVSEARRAGGSTRACSAARPKGGQTSDSEIAWDARGLAPAVVQDAATGRILMLAWMNREALAETRASGLAHFYSRSRAKLWKKGESSGNTLAVREIRVDCDGDALLLVAEPAGPTCHTGKPSCFFRRLGAGEEDRGPSGSVIDRLSEVIEARRQSSGKESYTRSLLDAGMPSILEKIAEEHGELGAELPEGAPFRVVHEAADLFFHLLVGLAARGIDAAEVLGELQRRFGMSGHAEKAARR